MSERQGVGPLNLRDRLDNAVYARTLYVAEAKDARSVTDFKSRKLPCYRFFAESTTEKEEITDPRVFDTLCALENGLNIAEMEELPVGTVGLRLQIIKQKLIPGNAAVEKDGMYLLSDAAKALKYVAETTSDAEDPAVEAKEASKLRRSQSARLVRILSEKPEMPL